MKKYIVVAIGCIECEVDSSIIGVFDSEEKANDIAKQCEIKYGNKRGETYY